MSLATRCREIGGLLAERGVRVVFAESCTAGLVCASLGRVPGISDFLCGSCVTYRNGTKAEWLGVSAARLRIPGPVSAAVAAQMATGVLARTTEAQLSAAVTGHLGPGAPPKLDGHIYVAVACRGTRGAIEVVETHHQRLASRTRGARQTEAAERVLQRLGDVLRARFAGPPRISGGR